MMKRVFSRRLCLLGVGGVAVLLGSGASPALAASPPLRATKPAAATTALSAAADCTTPPLSQPFDAYGDANEYALVPGQAFDDFGGSGWTLIGGARIETTTLADGATGAVLDLPAGSIAISPAMCVQNDYPTARMMVRDLGPGQPVSLYAGYADTGTLVAAGNIPSQSSWSPSAALQTHPGAQNGWQLVQFGLVAASNSAETQVYNFYVDPRMTLN